jgi:hypothetical protein
MLAEQIIVAVACRAETVVMVKRAAIIMCVLLVWVPIWLTSDRANNNVSVAEVSNVLENGLVEWSQENAMYGRTTRDNMPWPLVRGYPTLGNIVNPDRVRILLLGDSFVTGVGLLDISMRPGPQIEDILNSKTASGIFEVTTLGIGGASTMTQAKWATFIKNNDIGGLLSYEGSSASPKHRVEVERALLVDFDVVVLVYVDNDVVASDNDLWLDYEPHGLLGEEYQKVLRREKENPHEQQYQEAIDILHESFPGIPKLVYQAPWASGEAGDVSGFVERGFQLVPRTHLTEIIDQHSRSDLMANPGDNHPGYAMQQAISMDIAAEIMQTLPSERLQRASTVSNVAPRRLVVSSHPLHLEIEGSTAIREVKITHHDPTDLRKTCTYPYMYALFTCLNDSIVETLDDKTVEMQLTACRYLGKPYAGMVLDRFIVGRAELSILEALEQGLELRYYGYDPNGFPVNETIGTFKSGETADLTFDGGRRRGLIFTESAGSGCTTVRDLGDFSAILTLPTP